MRRVIATVAAAALVPIVAWTAASASPEPPVDCSSPTTSPGGACVAPAPAPAVQPVADPAPETTTAAPETPGSATTAPPAPTAPTTVDPSAPTTTLDPAATTTAPTTVPGDPAATTTTIDPVAPTTTVDPAAATTTIDPAATTTTIDPAATTTTVAALPPEDLDTGPVAPPVETPSGRIVFAAGAVETGEVRAVAFPVAGPITYVNDWGACRDGCARAHKGNDLIGDRLQPILAMHDGVIDHLVNHPTAGFGVAIRDDEGWQYHVYHMNNDDPGTDDGADPGTWRFLPGIVPGARVTAGQQLGWMGDSGNSEGSVPHAHVEIHRPDGTAINPYWSLRAAQRAAMCAVGTVGQPRPEGPAITPAADPGAAPGAALMAAPDGAAAAEVAPQLAETTAAAAVQVDLGWLAAGWTAADVPAGWVPLTLTGGNPLAGGVAARFWISQQGFTPVDAAALRVGDARYDAGVDCSTAATAAPAIPTELGAILATIRTMESGGDYSVSVTTSTASGAYGFLDSSWGGYGGFVRAKDAPPAVQDAKAAEFAAAILARNGGDVSTVPVSWYIGHVPVGSEWDSVPKPQAGNRLTPREYQDRWMQRYATFLGNPTLWVAGAGGALGPAVDTSATCRTVVVDVGEPGAPVYALTQAQSFLVSPDGRAVPDAVDRCDPARVSSTAPSPGDPGAPSPGAPASDTQAVLQPPVALRTSGPR